MKKLLLTTAVVLAVLCICGCTRKIAGSDLSTAAIINESSETEISGEDYGFEFDFLANAADLDFTGYETVPGFGCVGYFNPKYADPESESFYGEIYVLYTVSSAPDCSDSEQFVTHIHCTDPEVKFFNGLTLADDGELKAFLESNGFIIEMFDGIPTHFTAKKGRVFVNYLKDGMISIGYEVTNYKGMEF